jgi:hypothetical protein
MVPCAGSATGLNAGSQPSGTRLGGTTASVDGGLCDGWLAVVWDSRSPLLIRFTETECSTVVAELLGPLMPTAAGPFIITDAKVVEMIIVAPTTRDNTEPVELLVIVCVFMSHPRYR